MTSLASASSPAQRAPGGDAARFTLGEWLVDLANRSLQREDRIVVLEPRPMAVLAELCRRPREVIGAEDLLEACWPDETMAGDNQVHKAIAMLRRALQDSATTPRYIETIRKRGYCLVAPVHVLSEHGPRSRPGGWRGQSPFRGLEPFGGEHAGVFFGRNEAVAELHARLGRQWQRGHPLVVLLGPSGSGKTSLVQAGLLPALRMRPPSVAASAARVPLQACSAATLDLAALSDLDPWSALAGALLDWEWADAPLLSGHSIETLARTLREQCDEALRLLRIALVACSAMQDDVLPHAPPVLVLDRLEALFQPAAQRSLEGQDRSDVGADLSAEAGAFINCIDRLVRSRLLLVLGVCRNDFYPSLAQHPALMRDKEHGAHMDLAPPDAAAIAQMIRLPARAADLVYGCDPSGLHRLDDRLCADAMQAPDALPLLQYTLQELYLNRGPGNELSWEAYEALGRLDGAIGRRADAVVAGLPPAQQNALGSLLPRLMGVSVDEAAVTGRWVADAELEDVHERALVQALVDARLLVADRVGGSVGVRVAHEALLRRWPRVTQWIAQHRASLGARDELAPWVRRWNEGGRVHALLMPRGSVLWQAAGALAEMPRLFSEDEREYVSRSRARIRRQARWRIAAAIGAFALAIVAGLAALGYARLARVASERERQSQRLASFMLGDLADQLRPIGKLELLDSIGEQGLKLLGETSTHGESPHDTLQRAKALVVIGEVNSSRGKARTGTAMAALRQAAQLLEPLKRVPGLQPAEVYKTLGASAFWLGQIAFDAEDLETAAREMARYREACQQWLAVAPADPQARTELGFALNSLGSIAFKRGAWAEAAQAFDASLKAKLALLSAQPGNEELLEAAANSRFWLAITAHVQGQATRALGLFDEARSAQQQLLAAHPREASRLRDLSVTDVNRAATLQALGRYPEAVRTLAAAVAGLRQAVEADPSNRRWRAEALHAQAGLVLMQIDAGLQADAALGELLAQLARASDDAWSGELRLQIQGRVAAARAERAAHQRDWTQAKVWAKDADRVVADLLGLAPHHWRASELQARMGLLAMRAHEALGELRERTESCARTRDRLQPAVDSGQGGLVLEAWLLARACGESDVDGRSIERLTSGGYQPLHASHFQTGLYGRNLK